MKKLLLILFLLPMLSFASPAPQKLTVMLNWFPNPNHAPLIIAEQRGFFKEQGLDVKLIGPTTPNAAPRLVADGKVDLGLTYEPQFLQQLDHGMPLVRIGTLIDKPLACVVALKGSGIKHLSDLKGMPIGVNDSQLNLLTLKTMLHKQGFADKDIRIVNVRYNLTQALLSQRVKAVAGLLRNRDVPLLELQHQQVLTFFPEDYGVPAYAELVFITNSKNKHDARWPRFLAAVKKAVRYIDEHPQESWKLFADRFPELDTQANLETWFATMPYFAEDPGMLDAAEHARFAGFMRENHLIRQA